MALIATGNVVADAVVRIRPDSTDFSTALRQTVASNLLNLEKQSGGFFDKLTGSFAATTKAIAATGTTTLALFSSMAVKSAMDLEKTSNSFKGLFGSVAEGRKEFDKVFELAEKTPFEGGPLAKNFQRFTAAFATQGKSISDSSEKTMEILKALADGGAALGATTENVDGFALALSQTIGKGKLTGEEVRQFTNNLNGFNVVGAVAAKTGQTNAQVYDQMRKGAISAEVAIDAIVSGLYAIPGAAGASERQLRTVSGALSTLSDIFQRASFKGLEDDLKVVSNLIVDNSEQFRQIFTDMSNELGNTIVTLSASSQQMLLNFDQTLGKFAVGGLQAISAGFYGFSDGLNESLMNLGRLGDMLQRNQGQFVLLGKSVGNLSVGWSNFYTTVVEGVEPILQVSNLLFNDFSKGFVEVFDVFGESIKTGLFSVATSFGQTTSLIRAEFKESFDPEVAFRFLNALGQIPSAIIRLVVGPLDAVGDKSAGIVEGIENIFDRVTPKIQEYAGSFYSLGDSFGNLFESLNVGNASDFLANTIVQIVDSFATLNTYGAIAINIVGDLLGVVQPLLNAFGLMPEKAAAAFAVFKITGSPLLTLISLFKDLDTGMIAFFLTLSKALPLIRQFQATLTAFKTTDVANNLSGLSLGFRSLVGSVSGLGKVAPQSAAQFIQSMVGVEKFSKTAANGIIKNMGPLANLPIRTYEAQRAVADFAGTVPAATRNTSVLTNGLADLNKQYRTVGIDASTFKNTLKSTGSTVLGLADDVAVAGQTWKNYNKATTTGISGATAAMSQTASAVKNTAVNTEAATQKAGALSGALGGIPGILTTLGIGVGVSLLTSQLASAAEQAQKTKAEIQALSDSSYNFRTAEGQRKEDAVNAGVQSINDRFKDNSNALKTFNKLLSENGYSQEQFYREINGSEKQRRATTGKLVDSYLKELQKNNAGKDIFESQNKGKRNISDEANKQAISFVSELAKSGGSIERGLDLKDRGVIELIAKRAKISVDEYKKATREQKEAYLEKAKIDKALAGDLNNLTGSGIQFKKEFKDVAVVLGQISDASLDAATRQKAMRKAMQDSEEAAKESALEFKNYAESQRVALSSTSAFYDKVFEYNNAQNVAKLKATVQTVRDLGISSDKLLTTQAGRDFFTPFSNFLQSEDEIKTNINAPISQQIGLLRQSNAEFEKLAKNIGLSTAETKDLRVELGDLSFAEDFGDFVNNLQSEGKATAAAIKTIVGEAVKLDPEQQQVFIDSIANKDLKKNIEKQLEDLNANISLGLNPEALSDLAGSIEKIGAKNFTLDFALGKGIKNYEVSKVINELFASAGPSIDALNKKLQDGELSSREFLESVKTSRKELIKVLTDSGVAAEEANKLFRRFGFDDELSAVKVAIEADPKKSKEMISSYLASLKDDPALKFKAKLELDQASALKEFESIIERTDHANKSRALGLRDTADIAKAVSGLNMSAKDVAFKVIPEIDPSKVDSFMANLLKENKKLALEVVPKLNEEQLKNVVDAIPDNELITILTQMKEEELASTLRKIPEDRLVEILPSLNEEEKKKVFGKLTVPQVAQMLPQMSETAKKKFLADLAAINPTIFATISIPRIAVKDGTTVYQNGRTTFKAAGDIIRSRMDNVTVGENGDEAIIPLTRPGRALDLLRRSGLYDFAVNHAGINRLVRGLPVGGGYSSSSVDNSRRTEQKINIDMRGTKTTDPEALAMFIGSEFSGGFDR